MVARIALNKIKLEQLHLAALPGKTRQAFLALADSKLLVPADWYLADGSALALQLGHRQSLDLDFFTWRQDFNIASLAKRLNKSGQWKTTLIEDGTLYGVYRQVKLSFLANPFFKPSAHFLNRGNLRILSAPDIAAMKVIAISQRGRKRDFVDLFWYCRNREPLAGVIKQTAKNYPAQKHNINHYLKSLVYFVDAEKDPLPKLHFKTTWQEIKKYFQRETLKVARERIYG